MTIFHFHYCFCLKFESLNKLHVNSFNHLPIYVPMSISWKHCYSAFLDDESRWTLMQDFSWYTICFRIDEQSIPSGADLNDYISDNFQVYSTNSQAITQTILNRPVDVNDNRFTLETWKNGSYNYIQRLTHCAYTATRPPVMYIRSCSGGSSSAPDFTWSDWYKFTPVKVENNTNMTMIAKSFDFLAHAG